MIRRPSTAVRNLAVMSAAIFAVEVLIMFEIEHFELENPFTEAVVDATVLTIVLFPALYFFLFRALLDKHEALLAAGEELEACVMQRTGELQDSNAELLKALKIHESHHETMAALGEIGQLFQACREPQEVYEVAAAQIQHVYRGVPGALYLLRPSRNVLERVTTWCDDDQFVEFFVPNDCWAMRREQVHETTEHNASYGCRHFEHYEGMAGLCLPIRANGETLGILCMDTSRADNADAETPFEPEAAKHFLTVVTGSLALAISNIRFREELRSQAVRDQLTGLYNRRFLEETMEIEINRASRSDEPFSMIMMDVDHFKTFNDVYGHEGGDSALLALGAYLRDNMRKGDVACRFGGEEFAVLMPKTDAKVAMRRADEIRRGVEDLEFVHDGHRMDRITISCGVASFPTHAISSDELIRAADHALYASKANGRNQVNQARVAVAAGATATSAAAQLPRKGAVLSPAAAASEPSQPALADAAPSPGFRRSALGATTTKS